MRPILITIGKYFLDYIYRNVCKCPLPHLNSVSALPCVRVLQENGNDMSCAHSFRFELLYTMAMQWPLKTRS